MMGWYLGLAVVVGAIAGAVLADALVDDYIRFTRPNYYRLSVGVWAAVGGSGLGLLVYFAFIIKFMIGIIP